MDEKISKQRNSHKSKDSFSVSTFIKRSYDLSRHPKIEIRRYEQYGFASQEELDSAVATAQANMQKSYAALKSFDPKIAEQKTLQDWILKYIKTKDVCKGINAIKKDKDRAAYRQKHEADFIIYESARRYFDSQGIKKLPTNAAIRAEIQRLIAEKNAAYNAYYADKERFKELQTIQQNLVYMRGEPQPERSKKHEQSL